MWLLMEMTVDSNNLWDCMYGFNLSLINYLQALCNLTLSLIIILPVKKWWCSNHAQIKIQRQNQFTS